MRILVIRLSAIGDIVMASPLVKVLKDNYPDAQISWLVQPESAALLEGHPDIDEVIIWQRAQWQELLRRGKLVKFFAALRAHKKLLRDKEFDLALDLQGLLKSGVHAWLSGAKKRVGLGSKEGSQHLMTEVIARGGNLDLIGSEYSFLADKQGWDYEKFPMHIEISKQARQQAQAMVAELGDYVVICPFTTRPQKHWFEDAWLDLIPQLQTYFSGKVVVLGGPADADAAVTIASQSNVVNLVGQTSLQHAAAIIDGAQAVIGVDTGLTHMGIAFARPTVAMFGSTCPYLDTRTDNAAVIYHNLSCAPCQRNPSCDGAFTCMRDITPSQVIGELTRLTKVEST